MGGKSSQRKGANGERELAAILSKCGYRIERGVLYPMERYRT